MTADMLQTFSRSKGWRSRSQRDVTY